jgi:hypothetical protein
MGIQPTKMQLYGVPQGNELVWGNYMLRQTGIQRFKKIALFNSFEEARETYYSWLDEYSEHQYCDGEK